MVITPPPPDPPKNLAEVPDKLRETASWVVTGGKMKARSTLEIVKEKHELVKNTVNGKINKTFGTHIGEKHLDVADGAVTAAAPSGNVFSECFRRNKFALGLGLATIVAGFAAHKAYRFVYPYIRRATKLSTNQRFEVVLLVGSPLSRVVKRLANDLNTRGYIVFVTVGNEAELKALENEKDEDIRPLIMDYESKSTISTSIMKLATFLDTPFEDDESIYYHFRGCIFVPDYLKLPKVAKLSELEAREFTRVSADQLFKFNDLLQSGLLNILKESNERKDSVEELNEVQLGGGYSKLLFVNFIPVLTVRLLY
ncbi:unnamed protein product [Ambrosiozyma monospora]|uniref:Unnamed protein product n=1 Tax=Ambrosiozyma monospora TaxID=43982 RepID=A0A9W7DL11_AMBMO|nr:unnamed protein product [Ambrosiozyma monospora]